MSGKEPADPAGEYHPDLEPHVQTFIHTTHKTMGGLKRVVDMYLEDTEEVGRQMEGRDDISPELRARVQERLRGYRFAQRLLEDKIATFALFKAANSREEGLAVGLTKLAVNAGTTLATGEPMPTPRDQILRFNRLVSEGNIALRLVNLSISNERVDEDLRDVQEEDGSVSNDNVIMAAANQLKNGVNPDDRMEACAEIVEFFIAEIVDEMKIGAGEEDTETVQRTLFHLIGQLDRDPVRPPPISRFDILVNLTVLCSASMIFAQSLESPAIRNTLTGAFAYIGNQKAAGRLGKKKQKQHRRRK